MENWDNSNLIIFGGVEILKLILIIMDCEELKIEVVDLVLNLYSEFCLIVVNLFIFGGSEIINIFGNV